MVVDFVYVEAHLHEFFDDTLCGVHRRFSQSMEKLPPPSAADAWMRGLLEPGPDDVASDVASAAGDDT
eukprot:9489871-Pyramimonas_sp.AAC.1